MLKLLQVKLKSIAYETVMLFLYLGNIMSNET